MATLLTEMRYNEISQKEALKTILEYARSSPNSFAIMKIIDGFLSDNIELETYKEIYAIFTDEVKNAPAGNLFRLYIEDRQAYESNTKIRFFNLPRSDNQNVESFIQDDKKYKLIIFSSVGCSPCHEAIPIYKQIYNDMSDELDMLYISVDTKDQAEAWNRILTKYEIPWRSYFSYNIEGGILQKYMLRTVPNSLLVNPDLTFERIDVRDEKDRVKLYELINKTNKNCAI
jgi:hypothetical protein